jgi:hypothetical protein
MRVATSPKYSTQDLTHPSFLFVLCGGGLSFTELVAVV